MSILSAAILGIIEGFTEFLPISSTAHLVIMSQLLGIAETDFVKSFIIAIQLGAILAVVILYGKRFITDRETTKRIVVAFLPTAVIGFALYKVIKGVFLDNLILIAAALVVGGIILVLFEKFHRPTAPPESDLTRIPYWKAFVIGCVQSLAVIPGVSRAAATVVGGMFLGIERKAIVEFSFLLAVPTMCAATGYDLLKSAGSFTFNQFNLLLFGFVVSFIFAIIGVTFLLRYIQRHSFTSFGSYRIVLGVLVLAWLFIH
jgi:undecaprenyl-diphosphatase